MKSRIKNLRKVLGLSQADFAEGIKLSQGAFSDIENGKNPCTDRNIKTICMVYGVNEAWLRTGEREMFTLPPQGELADDELDLLTTYGKLSPPSQGYLLEQAHGLLKLQNHAAEVDYAEVDTKEIG